MTTDFHPVCGDEKSIPCFEFEMDVLTVNCDLNTSFEEATY